MHVKNAELYRLVVLKTLHTLMVTLQDFQEYKMIGAIKK